MTPSTRNATKHTKARTRRRLTAQERLARDCRQAQHATEALQQALDDLGLPEDLVTEIGPVTTLTLVANSKMGEMTLSILTAEGHRNWVASCAEIAAAVGERMVERIRHQCQCWVRAIMPDICPSVEGTSY
jgi:hypothetical protein